jgi:2-polyprenyl-6-methoxyphenol hydroxylase-like FAD-dependent oxidoreductase
MKAGAERWPSVEIERAAVVGLERDADGRVAGVRANTAAGERVFRAALVVGCDGSQSLVRRELGIEVDRRPYDHEFLYIAADGPTDPPAAMHFYLDRQGVILVASRPRQRMRIAIYFPRGARGDLLKRPDPALYEYVVDRMPALATARFGRVNAHVYSLVRQLALRFSAPGAALVGDAAHTTHPTGATGMNLAISGAARLAELVGPVLLDGGETTAHLTALDGALAAYDAERRPAAALAVEHNHRQALRIWPPHPEEDPDGYARAANPASGWGVDGAGWGQDPAALRTLARAARP